MLMTKKEFFKRKNRIRVYNQYDNMVSNLHETSDTYRKRLILLRHLQAQYRNTEHIYNIITQVLSDVTSSYETCAYEIGTMCKNSNYKVDMQLFDSLQYKIGILEASIAKMSTVENIIHYFESNELQIRSK